MHCPIFSPLSPLPWLRLVYCGTVTTASQPSHSHTSYTTSSSSSMGRKHRKMSDKEAEDALTQQLVETGKREQLKEKVGNV